MLLTSRPAAVTYIPTTMDTSYGKNWYKIVVRNTNVDKTNIEGTTSSHRKTKCDLSSDTVIKTGDQTGLAQQLACSTKLTVGLVDQIMSQ